MKRINQLLLDMIPVVLGVLIALYINNWNDSNKENKYREKVLHSIQEEVKENIENIKSVIPYQKALVDSIGRYLENEELTILEMIEKTSGFKAHSIKSASWKALLNSRIDLFKYENVSILTGIEEEKQTFNIKLGKVMDFAYDHMNEVDPSYKVRLLVMTNDIIDTEKDLLDSFEKYLKLNAEK